jgi:hypothetical protein
MSRSILVFFCLIPLLSADPRQDALATLRQAVEFYRTKASIHGGYHYSYAEDLSYARSEHGEGFTQAEVQREATPIVGMTYLDAWEVTRDRYYLDAARETAYALVNGQLCSGGWDYFIEFDPQKRKSYPYRADGPCEGRPHGRHVTNLDDNTTQANVRLLARVDRELKFQDARIHEAARFALESLLKAQYPNGAWPQRFQQPPDSAGRPVRRAAYPASWPRQWPGDNYRDHYTLNDNTLVDLIDTFLEAGRIYNEPRYRAAAEKGGGFLLLAQMPDPQPGWAQQYDRDMHPAWARRFEPPSLTGGEAQSVVKMLLLLYRETGDRKYLEPVGRALDYYRKSLLPPAANPSEIRRRACPGETPCLARFFELHTNRPLYITKGTRVSVQGGPSLTVDGYELSHSDQSVITHYGVLTRGDWVEQAAREYERLKAATPDSLRRPDKLHGLSPWNERWPAPSRPGPAELAKRVQALASALDPRGAWLEDGSIGKANRLVSLYAAKQMVVVVSGKPIPIGENDTVEVFQGQDPPRRRVIRSETFARNVQTLCQYLSTP